MRVTVLGLLRLLSASGVFLLFGSSVNAQHVRIVPQLPAGGEVQAIITIGNTNFSAAVAGTLAVFNPDGSPRVIGIDGRGSASTFAVNVPAGQSVVLVTTPGGPLTIGMGKFTSDFPAGIVVRYQLGGSQIGVSDSPPISNGTLVFSTSGGNDTGLAIANSGATPVNLRLVYMENGQAVETVDPPELNPLAVNGSVAKFLSEFGLKQTGNRVSGLLQILTKTGGQFSALGLLLRAGQLASTTVLPAAAGRLSLFDFRNLGFFGTWTNTTFNSQGPAALIFAYHGPTNSAIVMFTLGGNVFGSPSTFAPNILAATFNPAGFTATGTSTVFGPMSMVISQDGSFTMTANSVPSTTVGTFQMTGQARPDKVTGTYTLTFKAGGSANGTFTMNNAGP
jgi:hypothetical protein